MHLNIHWPCCSRWRPLAGWVAAALGLVLGTRVAPQNVSYLFALVVLPLTFLGAHLLPVEGAGGRAAGCRSSCSINPLVYMCEGFRAALTTGVPHMGCGSSTAR